MVVFILTMISLHRALRLKYPDTLFFTWIKTPIYILVIFLLTLAYLMLPVTGIWGKVEFDNRIYSCVMIDKKYEYVFCKICFSLMNDIIYLIFLQKMVQRWTLCGIFSD